LGVDGLNVLFRYADVRLVYAGESTRDIRSDVNDEGRDVNESDEFVELVCGWEGSGGDEASGDSEGGEYDTS
jgi:hypothetical protein